VCHTQRLASVPRVCGGACAAARVRRRVCGEGVTRGGEWEGVDSTANALQVFPVLAELSRVLCCAWCVVLVRRSRSTVLCCIAFCWVSCCGVLAGVLCPRAQACVE
jgi:hypothetical protein